MPQIPWNTFFWTSADIPGAGLFWKRPIGSLSDLLPCFLFKKLRADGIRLLTRFAHMPTLLKCMQSEKDSDNRNVKKRDFPVMTYIKMVISTWHSATVITFFGPFHNDTDRTLFIEKVNDGLRRLKNDMPGISVTVAISICNEVPEHLRDVVLRAPETFSGNFGLVKRKT